MVQCGRLARATAAAADGATDSGLAHRPVAGRAEGTIADAGGDGQGVPARVDSAGRAVL